MQQAGRREREEGGNVTTVERRAIGRTGAAKPLYWGFRVGEKGEATKAASRPSVRPPLRTSIQGGNASQMGHTLLLLLLPFCLLALQRRPPKNGQRSDGGNELSEESSEGGRREGESQFFVMLEKGGK